MPSDGGGRGEKGPWKSAAFSAWLFLYVQRDSGSQPASDVFGKKSHINFWSCKIVRQRKKSSRHFPYSMTMCWRNTTGKCWRRALIRGEHTGIRPGSLPFSYNKDSRLVTGETGKKTKTKKQLTTNKIFAFQELRVYSGGRTGAHRQRPQDVAQCNNTLV